MASCWEQTKSIRSLVSDYDNTENTLDIKARKNDARQREARDAESATNRVSTHGISESPLEGEAAESGS